MNSSKNNIDRRSFLRTSALAGGGMIIGFNLFNACKPKAKPAIDISKLNFNDFNGFIKIADNGMVTIFSPNPEIGQGVKTSMPMLIAEELDVAWENVHVAQGGLDMDVFERQVAGGSQSIRHGWEPLRQTGATAKQMLVNAAAAKWGVDASECSVENGIISNKKGEKLGYGEVVLEAAKLEIPKDVKLKEPKDFKIIGQDVKNVDVDKIITGKPLFGIDFKREGMLYASVMRPPAFGQKLSSFDDSDAKTKDGVVDVFQFGDKIAVLATSTWQAMQAKKSLKANWEVDTTLESTEDHDKILMGLLDGSKFETLRTDGNVKKAFKEADKVLERTYESPFLPHNCLEPMNFFANVTDEKVELVGPIQTPAGTANRIAKELERDIKDVTLEMTRMGGGFGRRLYGDFAIEAATISNIAKKPVQVIFSREDDMADGIYRPAIKYRIKAAIKDAKVTGYHLKEAAINNNMYGLIPNFFPAGAIENYQVDVANYKSNITTGAWRAPYTNFLAFAEQSFFDELAETMGVDNIQLRLDLLQNVKGTTDERIQYSPERLEGVIKLAVEKSDWGKKDKNTYQGFSSYYCHNSHVAEVADVVMESGVPIVKKVTCAIDCGIVVNPLGAKNQVEGGVIDGIGHAMYGNLEFKNGVPQSANFNNYRLIRMQETPQVEVHFVENDIAPTGLGEPSLPPAGAAIANAIKAATGIRLTKQPFINSSEKIFG
ncbi:molybdopterin cofactor-binding domain-containing protein [Aureibaculum sp. 2210JD6-5]|uniref:xanthine dehydrogenase family protein molybdopterin-binding subunit n=1 Tax=Aureibaculum sp. 2210JD6-5 TaxID=3103957 RepID=UPI002AADD33E|nr:molybdopterin cofactor-binding domain-containing protein [Aureibaculum sp. 2210JD6-5]MDY7394146.1 molybdopterin cofactor-binding domain-containing protein [Aureibaculum sp. 2210JD6-5]